MSEIAKVDTATLIHIGVELIVVAGLAFWVHKKTNNLQDQITALNEKINSYEEHLKRQGELLAQHENVLRQLFSNQNTNTQQVHRNPKPRQRTSNPEKVKRPNIEETFSEHTQSFVDEIEEGQSVDDLLADEIADLNSEDHCDVDGSCDIKQGNKKK